MQINQHLLKRRSRIENKSKRRMIEVQTGEYLEEDDIKRFKDLYQR